MYHTSAAANNNNDNAIYIGCSAGELASKKTTTTTKYKYKFNCYYSAIN